MTKRTPKMDAWLSACASPWVGGFHTTRVPAMSVLQTRFKFGVVGRHFLSCGGTDTYVAVVAVG
eukprot:5330332-Prorocentrum_lima.AAC.1